MTGRSIRSAGITIRVATARIPGVGVMVGDADGDGLGLPDGDGDGEPDTGLWLGSRVTSTGVSDGSGPAVVGSAYDSRPPVSSITPSAVRSAGTTRYRRRSTSSSIGAAM